MFTALAREKANRYWEGSFQHPFIQQLHEGTLAPEIFRYYLIQDRYYLEHFGKLYQLIGEQSDRSEIKALMATNAEHLALGEVAIRKNFFEELGITEDEIQNTAIAPTAYHYVSHMYRQLIEGTPNVAVAGMLPCAWLYQEIGTRLIEKGSPHALYQRWIETYAGEESKEAIQVERNLLDQLYNESSSDEQEQMLAAFVISSQMEYAFWEMAQTLETWD
ncbi:thiaminase II [Enterococcus sp. DIV2402]|uniref:Aminopyrimidine aminohydrolase n=1 Tax=Candidatus Enterococcus lowellii TaxID=2230877 RepID=A0ABZ2SIG9_9ENTE|nr:thiaminase II [Enterococcus sp. DIV2402]MBO0464737.1 thiaminase II [Enterococcus sp. DIV2402]